MAVVLSVLIAGIAPAAVPDGPRLAFVQFGFKPAALEIVTSDAAGAAQQVVAGGGKKVRPLPYPFSAPAWSPDGSLLAFSGISQKPGEHGGHPEWRLFVASSDGAGLRAIDGTEAGIEPVFSPDGGTIAFARYRISRGPSVVTSGDHSNPHPYRSVSVWIVGIDGGDLRQITPWRNGREVFPSSFSPDGSVLAVSRRLGSHSDTEAVALRLDGSGAMVLASHAAEPVYSPNGSMIAFIRIHKPTRTKKAKKGTSATTRAEPTTDLYLMSSDGSGSKLLTHTATKREAAPNWDPSGQRLAYEQLDPIVTEEDLFGFGDAIMEINADGSCRIEVLSYPDSALTGPIWQPGPGREAGRISC